MSFPKPVNGQIIRYSYLWHHEHAQGREEGIKDRPCAVVMITTVENNAQMVTVLPVTHSFPANGEPAIEIPVDTKQRLGLDEARSWIMLNEANRFAWPGPDLRPVGKTVVYGQLPDNMFKHVKAEFLTVLRNNRAAMVKRSE